MREILFRGKRTHSRQWAFGFYTQSPSGNFYITETSCGVASPKTVEPETVGQFVGLTDKNGKKIFEGDVIKAVIVRDFGCGRENREETGIIGYDKIGMIGLIAKYAGTIPVWSDFFQELTLSGCIDDFWFEVIGNIFDNKNLLNNQEVCE